MANEIITAGTKLMMGEEELTGLLSTPDLSQGEPEKIEVTTLGDHSKRYINGLKDIGDSLEFEFNYESDKESSYYKLKAVPADQTREFAIVLPDGLSFGFEAYVSVRLAAAAVGEQLKFTLGLTPAGEITVDDSKVGV